MQRLSRTCSAQFSSDLLYSRISGLASQLYHSPAAGSSLPSPYASKPAQQQSQSCQSSASHSRVVSVQSTTPSSKRRTFTALLHHAEPKSFSFPTSAPSLASTSLHTGVFLLQPFATVNSRQLHSSAYQHVLPHSELMQSEPEPESADKQQQQQQLQQQQQSGPNISLLNATQQRQWDHASNVHLGNILVKPQSHRKAHWTCSRCPNGLPHHWTAAVSDIYRSSKRNASGCPYCSGQAVCAHNSLAQRAPDLVAEWDTLRNADTPQDYTCMSLHRAHWVCAHGHSWQTRIADRVHRGVGCPDCAKARDRQRAPILTHSSGHIMQIWDHAENARAGLHPGKLTCGSYKRAHFVCPKGHQWTARIFLVSRNTNTTGCPACSGRSTANTLG